MQICLNGREVKEGVLMAQLTVGRHLGHMTAKEPEGLAKKLWEAKEGREAGDDKKGSGSEAQKPGFTS